MLAMIVRGESSSAQLSHSAVQYASVSRHAATTLAVVLTSVVLVEAVRVTWIQLRRRRAINATQASPPVFSPPELDSHPADSRTVDLQAHAGPTAVYAEPAPLPDKSASGTGFHLLRWIAFCCTGGIAVSLLIWTAINREWILQHPDVVLRFVLSTFCMLIGILIDIFATFADANRELNTITLAEVLYPLGASLLVFFGLWTRILDTSSIPAACYNSLTSGVLWRRLISQAKDRKID